MPRSNVDYWRAKLLGNRRRDRETDQSLAESGWAVVRIWEHEPPADAVERVIRTLAGERR
jgi:DNA mismatch endonuclease (patch repair protein)